MAPFYLDDVLTEPFVIEPPADVDLSAYTAATAVLRKPDGITETGLTAALVEGAVEVTVPADASVLDVPGLHWLRVTLTGAAGARRRLPALPIVVQDDDAGWHTLDSIRGEWPDAEHIGDATLWQLLDVARGDVLAFAPVLVDGEPVPERYRLGQRMHTRNMWNAARVAPDGGIGEGEFVFRPHPLDWHVKAVLRPRSGRPVVV